MSESENSSIKLKLQRVKKMHFFVSFPYTDVPTIRNWRKSTVWAAQRVSVIASVWEMYFDTN